jgi:hypothetical protein
VVHVSLPDTVVAEITHGGAVVDVTLILIKAVRLVCRVVPLVDRPPNGTDDIQNGSSS